MALINCPECNKQISDKANSCPHCGYPINNFSSKTNDDNYDVLMTFVDTRKQRNVHVIKFLRESKGISLSEAHNLVTNTPCKIFNNISLSEAKQIEQSLLRFNCEVMIKKSTNEVKPENKQSDSNQIHNYYTQESLKPKCPHCSSTNLHNISTTSKVIHGVAFGLFSKTARSQFECNNCGYKW